MSIQQKKLYNNNNNSNNSGNLKKTDEDKGSIEGEITLKDLLIARSGHSV